MYIVRTFGITSLFTSWRNHRIMLIMMIMMNSTQITVFYTIFTPHTVSITYDDIVILDFSMCLFWYFHSKGQGLFMWEEDRVSWQWYGITSRLSDEGDDGYVMGKLCGCGCVFNWPFCDGQQTKSKYSMEASKLTASTDNVTNIQT